MSEAVVGDEQAELVAQRVAELVGLAEGSGSVEEGFWAVRRLFEALSRDRPLVLVFEDVHWAEPKLLDLVEHLGDRASGPILALSITRPELLEHRPSWRDGSVWLRPLPEQHSQALVASLPGGAELPAELRSRIVAIAEGNPLFAEELLAYVEERGPRGSRMSRHQSKRFSPAVSTCSSQRCAPSSNERPWSAGSSRAMRCQRFRPPRRRSCLPTS